MNSLKDGSQSLNQLAIVFIKINNITSMKKRDSNYK